MDNLQNVQPENQPVTQNQSEQKQVDVQPDRFEVADSPALAPTQKGSGKVWTIIVTIILAGGIAGGSAYYYLNNKAAKEKKDLQTELDAANANVADLTAQIAALNKTTAATATTAAPDPTADWKTYDGSNFSVKYPSTWSAKLYGSNDDAGLYSTASPVEDASRVVQPNIIIASPKSFDSFTKDASQTVTVDGITGYWSYIKDATTVFFQKGNVFYEVTFWSNLTYGQIPQEQKTILSTLKFS